MDLGHTLVIRPGALGDAILTLPAVHALWLAGAKSVTVLGTPASWRFLRPDCAVRVCDFASTRWLGLHDDRVPLDAQAQTTLSEIHTAVVYLPDCADVRYALKRAGVLNIICASPPTRLQPDSVHVAYALLRPLEPFVPEDAADAALTIREQNGDPLLNLDAAEVSAAKARLALPDGAPLLGIHPGSGGRQKCWPIGNFAALASRACASGNQPLVFFGPADEELADRFQALVPGGNITYVRNRPLREVFALLSLCRVFVGNDSGVTHLAARACRTIALFGPTDPAVWGPLGKDVAILQAPGGKLDTLALDEVPV